MRLTLFNLAQLERHAQILASHHEVGTGPGRDRLLPRLADNEDVLLKAYDQISSAVQQKQRVSPAGEWLLDNFHLIEEQISTAKRHLPRGYSRELPHLINAPSAGFPRVYEIALEVIAHVDGRVDKENITSFVTAYQEIAPLKLGELWAIPIMLRLALIENLRRVAARVVTAMHDRNLANHWADEMLRIAENDPKRLLLGAADMARSEPPISSAFVAEFLRRLQGQSPAVDIPLTWIEHQLAAQGLTTEQTVQLEGQQQAANQVSVGASIGSLRFLGAMDWRDFVESVSTVEQVLKQDPAGIYSEMDFATRDHYRHVVERIAKRQRQPEWEVAGHAVALARAHASAVAPTAPSQGTVTAEVGFKSHVGYYLVDHGHAQFASAVIPPWPKARRWGYFTLIALITLTLTALIALNVETSAVSGMPSWMSLLPPLIVLTLICASQVAVAVANWLAMLIVPPHPLPRLDFAAHIPEDCRTLIAVPTLLLNPQGIERLLEGLEVRYLANRDDNLHFALLTDFTDALTEVDVGDDALLRQVRSGVEALNVKYGARRTDLFFLLHRHRKWNPREEVWMGYERKRGKLDALNALLRQQPGVAASTAFPVQVGDISQLPPVRYVITLDTDTQLPRDAARQLIGTMAHPLNRPVFDSSQRIRSGYAILQPRVAVSLPGARRSWFVRLYAGDPGFDPYTRAVSDVYQDLFQEGSFIGKGIYDVDAVSRALADRLPENRILSHDLLEGSYARCGLVSDVQFFEEHPYQYGEEIKRHHRWMRGDWQIASWLLPRVPGPGEKYRGNPLSPLAKWKIFDNLRRSVVPIAAFLLLVSGWMALDNPWFLTGAVLAMMFLPQLFASLASALRKPPEVSWKPHVRSTASGMLRHIAQAVLAVVFLPYEAYVSADAITRSFVRMLITHKNLLAWKSSMDTRGDSGASLFNSYRTMGAAPAAALFLVAGIALLHPRGLLPALPFVALWLLSPGFGFWLSRSLPAEGETLTPDQNAYLHGLARKTWRFFETFVGPEDNWLPPDNFQEYPAPVIAHRTSPTNMGLAALANLTAYDFGFLSVTGLIERTSLTFATMERMERFRGHFYNWYDTHTLKPLLPLYVSTVDSGNLAGLLLTLRPGLRELPDHKIIAPQLAAGLLDTIGLFWESAAASATPVDPEVFTTLKAIRSRVVAYRDLPAAMAKRLTSATVFWQDLTPLLAALSAKSDALEDDCRWWFNALDLQFRDGLAHNLADLAPWAFSPSAPAALWEATSLPEQNEQFLALRALLVETETIPTRREVARLGQRLIPLLDELLREPRLLELPWLLDLRRNVEEAAKRATEQILSLDRLMQQCDDLASFEYGFLYDKTRHLLTIGYAVSEHRRDNSYYDLLASEARLCSFVAIAQGSLPQEHWFALGRLLTTWSNEPTLLSWSGSMFEYLMPLLVMPTLPNTLLDQTYQTAVRRQIEYGNQRGVPWGISESGYNTTDVNLNYQYRAFGVPGLGFKRGLAEDLVIAPYASVMALMVAPKEACANLQRMTQMGFEGRHGFYEAIDFTPMRLDSGQDSAIVRSFMAHHQGMSFLSLAYHLLGPKMQERFLSDPLFKATELLLHERVPKVSTFYPHAPEVSAAARFSGDREALLRVVATPNTPRPEVHLLSNGRYSVMLTNSGGGYSRWKDLAVTRWREDPTCDNWGTFCYVRDVTNGEVWSAAHQPSLKPAAHYEAIFPLARAEFRRRDDGLEMHTEITVSPEDDIELRRFSITNVSTQRRVIELTSYAEVVLVPHAADEAHPAFSNLFLQTEILPEKQAILCTRRPRSTNEQTPTMLHLMTVQDAVPGEMSYETDRMRFIGRGRGIADPAAMDWPGGDTVQQAAAAKLSGTDGSVLDPIVAIRCRIVIEPEQTARVHIVSGIGETRHEAMGLLAKYNDRHLADRIFELAWTHRQVVLRQLNVSELDAQLYGRLASSVIYAGSTHRAKPGILVKNRLGQSGLWGHSISGDLPIVLLRIGNQEHLDLVRQLVQAQSYWRMMGLRVDLVIWNEDDSGYRQLLHEQITNLIAAGGHDQRADGQGGVFIVRAEQMTDDDRALLQTVARAIITDTGGTLAEQLERRGRIATPVTTFTPTRKPSDEAHAAPLQAEPLLLANGLGGFTEDGREYVITTSPGNVTPAPWVNVIANPSFGSVVSESGAAYTWCENAHEFRLTPWQNDAVTDNSGEAFYIRDEETGEFWSPTPLPARGSAPYITRHGFGYSIFQHCGNGIHSELTTFVASDAPVKFVVIKLRNESGRPRRISVTGYCEWVLGELRAKSMMHVVSENDPSGTALFARNPYNAEYGARIAFFDVNAPNRTVTCDRSEFVGRNGRLADPEAMRRTHLSGKVGAALDPCAAMQTMIELVDGEEHELVFLLGVGRDVDDVHTLLRRFGGAPAARQALDAVKQYWEKTLGAVQIKTPDRAMNVLANGWLVYQVISSRLWARSGYYQSGGAYGFRDQLQDAAALLHTEPTLLRAHILRCAAHQFREGDVQHWWHPPGGRGVRTHFSDDYLWLPLMTSRYVLGLGDLGVLDVRVNFIEGRQVKPDEEAYADLPIKSADSASLYEHCVRAIKRALRYGQHGLPLIGCGDWNDGMNLVGQHGKGESVWLAFFLFDVLNQFEKVAALHGDTAFAEICKSNAALLNASIETEAWDGDWYRRAYFDDGTPLGSAENVECQIDSLPQSWSVLSGAGSPERARKAMAAVGARLVDRNNGIIKLFDPPFDKSELEPGYIKGYVPGVRENGGQYTHAAIWAAMAYASLGEPQNAWELMTMINPLHHGDSAAKVATYRVEPYVMAADVYAVAPHTGRGGWTWYTGAAGWMYRLIVESLLGLRLDVDKLYFAPCLPSEWSQFEIRYRYRETWYDISVSVSAVQRAKTSVTLDGVSQEGEALLLVDDRVDHKVNISITRGDEQL